MRIRVDPSILRQNSGIISGISNNVDNAGHAASSIAQSAPSYDGQFAPRVQAIGNEALAKAQGLFGQMNDLSSQLLNRAQAFEAADLGAAAGFQSGFDNAGGSSKGWRIWLLPYHPLIDIISKYTWLGKLFSPKVTPTVLVKKTDQNKKLEDLKAKAKQEQQKQEAEAKKKADAKKKEEEKNKPKYISEFPARKDDGTFLAGQDKDDSCTMASTRMALERATGVNEKESVLRTASTKIEGGYHNQSNWGSNPSSVQTLINDKYSDIASATYVSGQTVADLKKAADAGKGIIVSVKNSEWFGSSAAHSVTVIGVKTVNNQQVVLVNDPWPPGQGKRLEVPASDFQRAWYSDATYISKVTKE